jgi:hypothetical protein
MDEDMIVEMDKRTQKCVYYTKTQRSGRENGSCGCKGNMKVPKWGEGAAAS